MVFNCSILLAVLKRKGRENFLLSVLQVDEQSVCDCGYIPLYPSTVQQEIESEERSEIRRAESVRADHVDRQGPRCSALYP